MNKAACSNTAPCLIPLLSNTIGYSAGLLLFVVIIVLLIRDKLAHHSRHIKLPLIAP